MRNLSEAQARVIGELLVDRPGSDRLKWGAAGVPRSTFQLVRRNALAMGWVFRRYVPAPAALGVDWVRVEVGQPFAEKRVELLSRLSKQEGIVVLWDSPGVILAVSFRQAKTEEVSTDRELGWSRRWVVESSVSRDEVVAYFDFEGAWSQWALAEAPRAYPRGLKSSSNGPPARTSTFRREDLVELVRRPLSNPEDGPRGFWPLGGLPRRLEKLVDRAVVVPRILPDLAKIPGLAQRELESFVLASGIWGPGRTGRQLFEALVSRSRATPFLYAYDTNRVVMGLLAAAPATLAAGRAPITAVLGEHLREIEVLREPIASISPTVNHRYDRLVSL